MNTLEYDLEAAAHAVSVIIGDVESAAKVIADACGRHPGFIAELHKKFKMQVSIAYLRRLERCGRGELHPALCLCIGPGQPFVEKLSRSDQERIVNGIPWPDGDSHRIRPLSELDYIEAKAAFFGGAIADLDTISRRMASYKAKQSSHLDRMKARYSEIASEREAAVREVESHGINYERGVVIIPKNTKIKAEHLAEWLYSHGH